MLFIIKLNSKITFHIIVFVCKNLYITNKIYIFSNYKKIIEMKNNFKCV